MVSSITPNGAAGASALGADQRLARSNAGVQQRREAQAGAGDSVELSRSSISTSRESVRNGIAQVQEALALGHDAQAMLVQINAATKSGSQADLQSALSTFAQRLEAAIARGAALVTGGQVSVQAEPGAVPVSIDGADLRLKAEPAEEDVLAVSSQAEASDPGLPQAVQKSLEKLQEAMTRLLDSVRALEAHQGFLGAAEAASVRSDLDADTARLMALQVRQGLEQSGGVAIANAEPQAVLSLFKA